MTFEGRLYNAVTFEGRMGLNCRGPANDSPVRTAKVQKRTREPLRISVHVCKMGGGSRHLNSVISVKRRRGKGRTASR